MQPLLHCPAGQGLCTADADYDLIHFQINTLAVAKDSERLQLLKDVAGTTVYDEKRVQSLKLLDETRSVKQQIEDALAHIDERLAELEVWPVFDHLIPTHQSPAGRKD